MLAFSGKKFLVRWFSTNVYAGARAFLGKSNFLFGSGYAGLGIRKCDHGHSQNAGIVIRSFWISFFLSQLGNEAPFGADRLRTICLPSQRSRVSQCHRRERRVMLRVSITEVRGLPCCGWDGEHDGRQEAGRARFCFARGSEGN